MTRLAFYTLAWLLMQLDLYLYGNQIHPVKSGDHQDSLGTYSSISVAADISGIRIFVDTSYIGVAPLDSVKIAGGFHIIRFIHPDSRNWWLRAVVETVFVKPSEHLAYHVKFPYLYKISTVPFNATVTIGDSMYGTTPVVLTSYRDSVCVSVSKEGFKSITQTLPGDIGRFDFLLKQVDISAAAGGVLYLSSESSKGYTAIYFSAAATITAGTVAAYCKIKADGYYRDYQRSGNEALLGKVRSFDRASGISLVAAEIGFFLLSYLIFSQ